MFSALQQQSDHPIRNLSLHAVPALTLATPCSLSTSVSSCEPVSLPILPQNPDIPLPALLHPLVVAHSWLPNADNIQLLASDIPAKHPDHLQTLFSLTSTASQCHCELCK